MIKKIFLSCVALMFFVAPAVAGTTSDLEEELLTGLLKESARVIKNGFGLDGKTGNTISVVWDDDPSQKERLASNVLAVAEGHLGIPYETVLVLNSELFREGNAMSTEDGRTSLRLTVLHELTHGMQFASMPGLMDFIAEDPTQRQIAKGQFLYEGMAEYAADGNNRILGYVRQKRAAGSSDEQIARDITLSMALAMSTVPDNGGYNAGDLTMQNMFYITSYLATRWLDTESKKHGGSGIKGFIDYLEAHGYVSGENSWVFDNAFDVASNGYWKQYADFSDSVIINKDIVTSTPFYRFVLGVVREDASVDAGRVGGYYATGVESRKEPRTAAARSLVGQARDEAPLKDYGFVSTTIFGKQYQKNDPTRPEDPGSDPQPPYTPEQGEHDIDVDVRESSSSWSAANGGHLTVKIAVDFSKFTGVVSLDGVLLAQDTATTSRDFGARSGSTIITVWEEMLRTHIKSSGEHYVSVGFSDGMASHKITASVPKAPVNNDPAHSSGGGGCAVGGLTIAAAMIAAARRRSR